MFAGCSEISECVIGKHVQHVGVIRSFYLLGGTCGLVKFFIAWGDKKIAGSWFATGDQYPG